MTPRTAAARGGHAAAILAVLLGLAVPGGGESATRPRVGLALGGGSARGIAHVGVLQWLEEHRVPVDLVAGTSMGGVVGGAYATGMSPGEIQDLLRNVDWDRFFQRDAPYAVKTLRRKQDARQYPVKLELGLRRGLQLPSGLNPGQNAGLLLSRIALPYSTVSSFDELPIPFRCVATDMEKGEAVVLGGGALGSALRATMAIPGVFDPVRLDGRLLADGGVLNNLPVDVVRAMGAEVVIAVSVSAPRPGPPSETIVGLVNRSIDLMMEDMAQAQLRRADRVIEPDLEGIESTDYRRTDAIVARGYAAAAAQAEFLLPLALDERPWEEHLAGRAARRRPLDPRPAFVEVGGVGERAAADLADDLRPLVGGRLDLARLEAHLDRVVGGGRYGSASYRLREREGRHGLQVDVREKPYAPPFVGFSLDINNEREDVSFNFGSRITVMDVAGYGSEWRIDLALGSTLGGSTELLVPVGGGGAFVAPRVSSSRRIDNLYEERDLVAVYRRERTGAGADLGWHVGRGAQIRLGYEISYLRNTVRVGDPLLPQGGGQEHAARVRVDYDGFDNAYFPRRGLGFESTTTWFFDTPGGKGRFGQAAGGLSLAWPVGGQDRMTASASGGASFGVPPPPLYALRLGGPLRLGAFGTDELRGRHVWLGRLGYLKSLARLPDLVGDRLFLVGLVEAGSAFDRPADARVRLSVTAGLAADTFVGPLFAGASVGDGGEYRIYFTLGKLFR